MDNKLAILEQNNIMTNYVDSYHGHITQYYCK